MSKKNGLKHSETAQHRYENVKIIRNFDKKYLSGSKYFTKIILNVTNA
jgi:hypothetical protein